MLSKVITIFGILFLGINAFAEKANFEKPDKGDRIRCHTTRLESCFVEHRAAIDWCNSSYASLNTEVQKLAAQLNEYQKLVSPYENKINIIDNSLDAAKKEVEFLTKNSKKNQSVELQNSHFFDDDAQLEKFFRLAADTVTWNETFPTDHLNQLNKFTSEFNDRLIILQQEKDKLVQNITYLNSQITSYEAQKNDFAQALNTHAMMLKEGCNNLFCPSN